VPVQRRAFDLIAFLLFLMLAVLTSAGSLWAQEEEGSGGGSSTMAICNPSPCPPKRGLCHSDGTNSSFLRKVPAPVLGFAVAAVASRWAHSRDRASGNALLIQE
jgi:hypothetical protein